MGTRLTALDRAASAHYSDEDYALTIDRLLASEVSLHLAARGMNDDALYARTMVAAIALREVMNALYDAQYRNERENEAIRAILGNA
jgi:hypothetical protein